MNTIFKVTYLAIYPFYNYLFTLSFFISSTSINSSLLKEDSLILLAVGIDFLFLRLARGFKPGTEELECHIKWYEILPFCLLILLLFLIPGKLNNVQLTMLLVFILVPRALSYLTVLLLQQTKNGNAVQLIKFCLPPMSPLNGRPLNFGDIFGVLITNVLLIFAWFILLAVVSKILLQNGEDFILGFLTFVPVVYFLTLFAHGIGESKGELEEFVKT